MKTLLLGFICLLSWSAYGLEYSIQFDNDQICVAKVKIHPHEEIGLHRDVYPQVVVALKGGTITRLEANGQSRDVEFPTGIAVFTSADPEDHLHTSVNKSDEVVELLIIQLKNSPKE